MNKKTLLSALPTLLLLVIAIFQGKSGLEQRELIDDLQAKLSVCADIPAAVVASGNQVEVVYRDRVKTVYLPAEGKVSFNTVKYQNTISALDSLTKLRAGVNAEGYAEDAGANASEAPRLLLAPLGANQASIDSLRRILANPQASGLLKIKTWGLCARPQIGCGWNGQLAPYVGCKFIFYNRFGVTAGVTSHQAGIGVTYRVDRWVKFLRNTEVMGLYGVPFKRDSGGAYVGLVVNL